MQTFLQGFDVFMLERIIALIELIKYGARHSASIMSEMNQQNQLAWWRIKKIKIKKRLPQIFLMCPRMSFESFPSQLLLCCVTVWHSLETHPPAHAEAERPQKASVAARSLFPYNEPDRLPAPSCSLPRPPALGPRFAALHCCLISRTASR